MSDWAGSADMGRPTDLTEELATAIVVQVGFGIPPVVAAGAMGVARSTYYQWIARGEGTDPVRLSEPIYIDFADRVRAAESQSESTMVYRAVHLIRTTADAVMMLERRFPERWKRTEELTINIRREAEKIAAETGLDANDIMAEVESILGSR